MLVVPDLDAFSETFQIDELLTKLNEKLNCLDMSIKKLNHESTGEIHYSIASSMSSSNPITQAASNYDAKQLAYFKLLVAEIVKYNGKLEREDAIKLRNAPINNTAEMIVSLINEKWIEADSRGYIHVGIRTLVELKDLLTKEFDCPECNICEEPVLAKAKCSNPKCSAFMHKHCQKEYFERNRGISSQNKCPFCHVLQDGEE
jgi:hypothetical protein